MGLVQILTHWLFLESHMKAIIPSDFFCGLGFFSSVYFDWLIDWLTNWLIVWSKLREVSLRNPCWPGNVDDIPISDHDGIERWKQQQAQIFLQNPDVLAWRRQNLFIYTQFWVIFSEFSKDKAKQGYTGWNMAVEGSLRSPSVTLEQLNIERS